MQRLTERGLPPLRFGFLPLDVLGAVGDAGLRFQDRLLPRSERVDLVLRCLDLVGEVFRFLVDGDDGLVSRGDRGTHGRNHQLRFVIIKGASAGRTDIVELLLSQALDQVA